eukprot:scaffold207860_cov34-Prasinocladus_malaysianus.AAC.1
MPRSSEGDLGSRLYSKISLQKPTTSTVSISSIVLVAIVLQIPVRKSTNTTKCPIAQIARNLRLLGPLGLSSLKVPGWAKQPQRRSSSLDVP